MSDPTPADWRSVNQAKWDERTAVHLGPTGYDLTGLRAGTDRLDALVEPELGPVAGLRVLHLQCHFGRDSLILANQGADVTGLDFSAPAIAAAGELASQLGTTARFVHADLYDAPAAIAQPHGFDLVFTTWGTICWLPDLAGWARIVASFLQPGGSLYFADTHPFALVFDDRSPGAGGLPGWLAPYCGGDPVVLDDPADYIDRNISLRNTREVTWMHTVADLIEALRQAGLQLEWLREHSRIPWQMFDALVRDGDGLWTWPQQAWLPLSLSLRARRLK